MNEYNPEQPSMIDNVVNTLRERHGKSKSIRAIIVAVNDGEQKQVGLILGAADVTPLEILGLAARAHQAVAAMDFGSQTYQPSADVPAEAPKP